MAHPNTFLRPKDKIENLQTADKSEDSSNLDDFGPNESRRRKLKFENFASRRTNEQTNKKKTKNEQACRSV